VSTVEIKLEKLVTLFYQNKDLSKVMEWNRAHKVHTTNKENRQTNSPKEITHVVKMKDLIKTLFRPLTHF
jgi:hypothetical protein